jgi:hypothetical protein
LTSAKALKGKNLSTKVAGKQIFYVLNVYFL